MSEEEKAKKAKKKKKKRPDGEEEEEDEEDSELDRNLERDEVGEILADLGVGQSEDNVAKEYRQRPGQ